MSYAFHTHGHMEEGWSRFTQHAGALWIFTTDSLSVAQATGGQRSINCNSNHGTISIMRHRHTLIDNCTSTQCHSLNIPSQCFVRLSVKVLDQYSVHKTLQYYSVKPQLLVDLYYWPLQHQLLTCPFAEFYVRLQTVYRIKHVSVLMFSFLSHTAAVLAVHILWDTLLSHVRDGDTDTADPQSSQTVWAAEPE